MKSFTSAVLAARSLASLQQHGVAAAPSNATHSGYCKNPLVRHEWRQLSLDQRRDYIRSVKSLMALPSEGNDIWPGAKSYYDNFQVYGVMGNGSFIEDVSDKDEFPVQKLIEIPGRSGGGHFIRDVYKSYGMQVSDMNLHAGLRIDIGGGCADMYSSL
ncbi:hypothetical protein CORC01_09849 [Colletotrichum orchidophilum]|uniref:Uncharacterized protein n=1 Tax=Colletotrichum orchidophilum TaxID=1209926 RepID=A0A1G4B0B8_9PEZI|nr:uncharacterized protein CORC01_09849 [Colletotrichum orchidophilum]OHE94831.1 hypothetical protein CORC01_09849 [Colletotrichum orchidophilum]